MFTLAGCISYEITSDQDGNTYFTGKGGSPPYTCELVEPSSIDPLSLENCKVSLTGDYPTETIVIDYEIKITDSTGKSTTVKRKHTFEGFEGFPLSFYLRYRFEVELGQEFSYSLCDPITAGVCGAQETLNPSFGRAPYSFSKAGLPSEIVLSPNGELKGTISAYPGEYPFTICVKDSKNGRACENSVLVIKGCGAGESLINGDCCADTDSNNVCDVNEQTKVAKTVPKIDDVGTDVGTDVGDTTEVGDPDQTGGILFSDDFSDGYLESNWEALYGTPEIVDGALKLTSGTLLIADTNPFKSENGVEFSVMVNVDNFDSNTGFSIFIRDQASGNTVAQLQFNKGQAENGINFWYYMYPTGAASKVLGTDSKTNDNQFHEYKFVINSDGTAAWFRDGIQKKSIPSGTYIPAGDMFIQFKAGDETAYIDDVIVR